MSKQIVQPIKFIDNSAAKEKYYK